MIIYNLDEFYIKERVYQYKKNHLALMIINSQDYFQLYDFEFLSKIVEHPRIESKYYPLIIKFILTVCLKNPNYNKSADYILGLILHFSVNSIIEKMKYNLKFDFSFANICIFFEQIKYFHK